MSQLFDTGADLENFSGVARIFPLPNLVMFPGMLQPLHIFEPRYRELLEDALVHDRLIAMAMLEEGWQKDYEGRPPIAPVACLGRIVSHQPQPEGRYNILLLGLRRVRVARELVTTKSFREAKVALMDDVYPDDTAVARPSLRASLVGRFRSILPRLDAGQEQLDQFLEGPTPLGVLADLAAHAVDMPLEMKKQLLAETNVDLRAATVMGQLDALRRDPVAHSAGDRFPPSFSAN